MPSPPDETDLRYAQSRASAGANDRMEIFWKAGEHENKDHAYSTAILNSADTSSAMKFFYRCKSAPRATTLLPLAVYNMWAFDDTRRTSAHFVRRKSGVCSQSRSPASKTASCTGSRTGASGSQVTSLNTSATRVKGLICSSSSSSRDLCCLSATRAAKTVGLDME